jgi:N-acetylglutamate synthase
VEIREFTVADYDEVLALWQASEGIGLGPSDTREAIAAFLGRNPGLCFTARDGGILAGAVLCGHDGRRGYLHHLAVAVSHRRRGVGDLLVQRCLEGLGTLGIVRCHLFVFRTNEPARTFWEREGWWVRDDLWLMSRDVAGDVGPEAQRAQRGCSC